MFGCTFVHMTKLCTCKQFQAQSRLPDWGYHSLPSTACVSPSRSLWSAWQTYASIQNAPGPCLHHSAVLQAPSVYNGERKTLLIFLQLWNFQTLRMDESETKDFFVVAVLFFSFFFWILFSFCKLATFSKPATHKQSETLKCLLCFYQQTLFGIT